MLEKLNAKVIFLSGYLLLKKKINKKTGWLQRECIIKVDKKENTASEAVQDIRGKEWRKWEEKKKGNIDSVYLFLT